MFPVRDVSVFIPTFRQHSDMVNFGAKYKDFDQAGKEVIISGHKGFQKNTGCVGVYEDM